MMLVDFVVRKRKSLLIGFFVLASCLLTLLLYPKVPSAISPNLSLGEGSYSGEKIINSSLSPVQSAKKAANEQVVDETIADTQKYPWNPESYARSLVGTDVDGELTLDESGNLAVTLEVKDFFDYFFSAVGEVSLDDAVNQIQRQAELRLPPNGVELESYMAYQHAMQDVMAAPLLPVDQQDYHYYSKVMARTFDQIKSIRRDYFSPEAADAFFAMEERFSEYAVETIKIRADDNLSESEKQQKVLALEATMPEQMRIAQEDARLTAQIANEAKAMYDEGADEESIVALLSQKYDRQTVAEMIGYYKREDKWQRRINDFMMLKSHIEAANLDVEDKEMQLKSLREDSFSKDEIARVLAHEAIARKQKESGA
jgi:lipase chaperone LimK